MQLKYSVLQYAAEEYIQ